MATVSWASLSMSMFSIRQASNIAAAASRGITPIVPCTRDSAASTSR